MIDNSVLEQMIKEVMANMSEGTSIRNPKRPPQETAR